MRISAFSALSCTEIPRLADIIVFVMLLLLACSGSSLDSAVCRLSKACCSSISVTHFVHLEMSRVATYILLPEDLRDSGQPGSPVSSSGLRCVQR